MFRPCIDVKGGRVVQLEQGARLALTDSRSPLEVALLYEADGLFGGHVIDLDGGKNREVILPALAHGRLQVGGGLKLDNGRAFLDAGATHLIFSSAVFKAGGIDWEMLSRLRDAFGRKHLVLAPDVRGDREIFVQQWTRGTGVHLDHELLRQLSEYCDEFLVHSIEVEGMEGGVDLPLVHYLATAKTGRRITYAGGGTDLEVVRRLHRLGLDITIGKAYFSGRLAHDDLLSVNRELAAAV